MPISLQKGQKVSLTKGNPGLTKVVVGPDLKKNIKARHYHVTFEPLFDDIGEIDFDGIDWIVIGTETGNRKGKSYSRPEWVLSIAEQAKAHGIPVFMKEDLLPIMGDERMIQELPEQFTIRIQ